MKKKANRSAIPWKYIILFVVTGFVILLDQVTKAVIIDKFRLGETISVIPDFFNITYVQNKGAAFGLLSQAHPSFRVPFFIIVPLTALFTVGYVFRKLPGEQKKMALALALVISGAIGNLIDRFILGYVIDFLDFHWKWTYHFPAFNVADTAICVGVGLIMLDLVIQETSDKASPKKGLSGHASHSN